MNFHGKKVASRWRLGIQLFFFFTVLKKKKQLRNSWVHQVPRSAMVGLAIGPTNYVDIYASDLMNHSSVKGKI